MADVFQLSLSLSRWLDTSVVPGVLLFLVIVLPAGAYWCGLASSYASFLGAVSFGMYVANRTANRKIERARSIASLHHLTDLDAATLKRLVGAIPPWVSFPDMSRASWINVMCVRPRRRRPAGDERPRTHGLSAPTALAPGSRSCGRSSTARCSRR